MLEKKFFYKKVFALVLPLVIQNLINVGVTAADVMMLGKVGETSLSAANLASQVQFILTLFIFGLGSGAAVLTSQYWGKRDLKSIEKIMGIALRLSILISLIFTILALVIPSAILNIFTNEQDVIKEGVKYLRVIAFSYVISSLTSTYLNIIRSTERVLVSTIIYSISLGTNILLNSIFIFGTLGCPAMGISGAALGTLIARILEIILVYTYSKFTKPPVSFSFLTLILKDKVLFKDFLTYASPVVANELLWGIGISANTAILGHLGTSVVAANSITQMLRQLAMVITFGLANTAAIMVGKAIGEGNNEDAKLYASRFVKLSLLFGSLGAILIAASYPLIVSMMTLTPQAIEYFNTMIFIMCIYCIVQSVNTTWIVGIFRGGGDTRYGLFIDVISMWCFSIIFGFLSAFVFHFPVKVVYFILLSDEIIKIPLAYFHYKKGKWAKNITRTVN